MVGESGPWCHYFTRVGVPWWISRHNCWLLWGALSTLQPSSRNDIVSWVIKDFPQEHVKFSGRPSVECRLWPCQTWHRRPSCPTFTQLALRRCPFQGRCMQGFSQAGRKHYRERGKIGKSLKMLKKFVGSRWKLESCDPGMQNCALVVQSKHAKESHLVSN